MNSFGEIARNQNTKATNSQNCQCNKRDWVPGMTPINPGPPHEDILSRDMLMANRV
ncbi:MAG: hypothetical protein ABIH87_01825 [bacterium]